MKLTEEIRRLQEAIASEKKVFFRNISMMPAWLCPCPPWFPFSCLRMDGQNSEMTGHDPVDVAASEWMFGVRHGRRPKRQCLGCSRMLSPGCKMRSVSPSVVSAAHIIHALFCSRPRMWLLCVCSGADREARSTGYWGNFTQAVRGHMYEGEREADDLSMDAFLS